MNPYTSKRDAVLVGLILAVVFVLMVAFTHANEISAMLATLTPAP